MPRPKVKRGNCKDHKVTVRLDHATYESLKEAMEQGTITNLSEALRVMIRQKIWEGRFSEEMGRDLRLEEMGDEELRSVVHTVLGNFGIVERRGLLKLDGFLEGLFLALGGLIKTAITEFDRREAYKESTGLSENTELRIRETG